MDADQGIRRMDADQGIRRMDADQNAIARTIWGEMRGEGEAGMTAVACVIMNRVAAKTWYGLTPYEVCHKPYQFSCWLTDDPNLPKIIAVDSSDPQFVIACQIAQNATLFNLPDTTDGALSYFSGDNVPSWAIGKTPCLTLGSTKYYNDIN